MKGEVFAIYLPNIVEYAIIFYGVGFAGGTSTTVNPLYTAEELEKQLSADTGYVSCYIAPVPGQSSNCK